MRLSLCLHLHRHRRADHRSRGLRSRALHHLRRRHRFLAHRLRWPLCCLHPRRLPRRPLHRRHPRPLAPRRCHCPHLSAQHSCQHPLRLRQLRRRRGRRRNPLRQSLLRRHSILVFTAHQHPRRASEHRPRSPPQRRRTLRPHRPHRSLPTAARLRPCQLDPHSLRQRPHAASARLHARPLRLRRLHRLHHRAARYLPHPPPLRSPPALRHRRRQ